MRSRGQTHSLVCMILRGEVITCTHCSNTTHHSVTKTWTEMMTHQQFQDLLRKLCDNPLVNSSQIREILLYISSTQWTRSASHQNIGERGQGPPPYLNFVEPEGWEFIGYFFKWTFNNCGLKDNRGPHNPKSDSYPMIYFWLVLHFPCFIFRCMFPSSLIPQGLAHPSSRGGAMPWLSLVSNEMSFLFQFHRT